MKPEIKQMWVDALRSGEFEQADGQLRDDGRYCCLGVLCELHRRYTNTGRWLATSTYQPAPRALGASADLPEGVQEWAGLESEDPVVRPKARNGRTLSELNDTPWSFKRIAKIIEERL